MRLGVLLADGGTRCMNEDLGVSINVGLSRNLRGMLKSIVYTL